MPDTPDECESRVASYVVPATRTFHEDIPVAGSGILLHYASNFVKGFDADVNDTTALANGWHLSVQVSYDGLRLRKGNGDTISDINVTTEGNQTIVSDTNYRYVFDALQRHTATEILDDHRIVYRFDYDHNGRLHAVTDGDDETLTLHYETSTGNVSMLEAPGGQLTALHLDDDHNLERIVYENRDTYRFSYDVGALLLAKAEPVGNIFYHRFDDAGRVTQVEDAEGGVWSYETLTEPEYSGSVIHYPEYESTVYKNYPVSNGWQRSVVEYADGTLYEKRTGEDGKIIVETQCGVTTETRSESVDPLNGKARVTSVTTTTPSGLTRTERYSYEDIFRKDGRLRRKTTEIESDGNVESIRVNYNNNRIRMVSAENRKLVVGFDEQMRHPLFIKHSGLLKMSYEYDENGRLMGISSGGRKTAYGYDDRGRLISVTNARGVTGYSYDLRDRPVSIMYPDGQQTQFAYDANGNMKRLTTPTPADYNWEYNGVNRQTAWVSPLGFETYYAYDKQRRIVSIRRPSGKTIEYAYANGHLTRTLTAEDVYEYDYSCGNKPGSISTDGSGRMDFAYDGDLLTEIVQSGVLQQTIGFTYNNRFLPESMTYAAETEMFAYDKDGLMILSGDAAIQRDVKSGLPIGVDDGNRSMERIFNGHGEMKREAVTVGEVPVYENSILNRDKTGRITRREEHVGDLTRVYRYYYDKGGRLIKVKLDKKVVEQYEYDANGNRTKVVYTSYQSLPSKQKPKFEAFESVTLAAYDIADRLERYGDATYAYDEDGYLASKITAEGTTHYSYGTLGELRSVVKPDGLVIEYLHNGNNQRIAKKVNGYIQEKYLWANLTTLLAVYDGDDDLAIRFEYADGRMPYKMTYYGETYYLAYDQVGTLKVVTDTNGTIVKTVEYDTFGNIRSDSNPDMMLPFGFAGGLYDPDTGLTRFGYRDYDAQTGKWTAKDPIGFNGGDTNLYGYVLGDPVNLVDLNGLSPTSALIAALVRTARSGISWIVRQYHLYKFSYNMLTTTQRANFKTIDNILHN